MTAELTGETFETTDGEFALAQQHEHDRNFVAWERVAARWVQITVRGKGGITKSKCMPIAATRQRFREFASLPAGALPFSFTFVSKNVETKTAPLFVPRLNAMPL